jgi:geranylgeranyl diphosphate synthase type I
VANEAAVRATTSLKDLQKRVLVDQERRLRRLFAREQKRTEKLDPELGVMVSVLSDLSLRGGKRLRPLLACIGALCHDAKADLGPVLAAGVSLELLQTYLLVHDDWMDQDATRRGGPTAHVLFEKHHKSAFLGERAAILTGDYAIALAQAELAALPCPPRNLRAALAAFARMQVAAVEGQRLDLLADSDPELTYELKTASYTVLGPLELGAALAGATPAQLKSFEGYARSAGVAFQLRDDLLNAFGDPKATGKPRGSDLRQGKKTPLVSEALRRLKGRDQKKIRLALGAQDASRAQIDEALTLISESGAREAIEARIDALTRAALKSLKRPLMKPLGRSLLEQATHELVERKS